MKFLLKIKFKFFFLFIELFGVFKMLWRSYIVIKKFKYEDYVKFGKIYEIKQVERVEGSYMYIVIITLG